MLKVMRIAEIKKKKVRIQNVPARGMQRLEEFDNNVLALDKKINEILKEDNHLLFLDECVFKSRDFSRTAYSNPK